MDYRNGGHRQNIAPCKNNIVMLMQGACAGSAPCQDCLQRCRCPAFDQLSADGRHRTEHNLLRQKTIHTGQKVFSAGERFSSLYMVRSGFFKSYSVDTNGDIQVTGFHFPGELFGVEGIDTGFHDNSVEALETGSFCRISLSLFEPASDTDQSRLSSPDNPSIHGLQSLIRVMGGIVARDRALIFSLGKMCAKRRFAAFLLDISARMQSSGFCGDEFRLCMSRIDMSNYLCLAIETISRMFTQFDALDIIDIDRRNLRILDRDTLLSIVADNHPDSSLLEKAG